jgi:hypothetical protein
MKYPKLCEYYNSIKEFVFDDDVDNVEIITIMQYMPELLFNYKIIDKKVLLNVLKNIVLTDDDVNTFLKNTTHMSIIDKMKYIHMCNYKLDFNSTILNLGRDIVFDDNEYTTISKDTKIRKKIRPVTY